MTNADKLRELAKERFGGLSAADEKLFKAVANGKIAAYSSKNEEENDPAKADKWSEERIIKADRIEWLCTDRGAKEEVSHNGIMVRGARIEGKPDLIDVRIPFSLHFYKCAFPKGMLLQNAMIFSLNLTGSYSGPINAIGIKAEGDIRLCHGFRAEGVVSLIGAIIAGQLDCDDGRFINPGKISIHGDAIKVGADMFFRDGFRAEGEVNLICAKISGQIDCSGGKFINSEGNAIYGDSMEVGGHVFLRNGFKADGEINLVGANITGALQWIAIDSPEKTILDLRLCKIGILYDDGECWPSKGNLYLHGLIYDYIDDDTPTDAKSRIMWLNRQSDDKFSPQPYEHLAKVLREGGHEEDAKQILIEKNKQWKKHTKFTWPAWWRGSWLWYHVLGPFIGYGYRPLNAFWACLLVILFGYGFVEIGWKCDQMIYSKPSEYIQKDANGNMQMAENYPRFYSLVYSADLFIPLIDLHQASYWMPKNNFILCSYKWIHIFAGWILTTLLIVGLTGVLRS